MTDAQWHRLADLVPEALDLPPDDRDAFLDRACTTPNGAPDPVLRQEAALLVAASDAADASGALASPVSGLLSDAADDANVQSIPLPERVGPWRVTGLLGEGGMGVVYRAERADGLFEREVALKRLRPGIGSRLAARLDAERRLLARLEHPAVARLYDGGVDGGAPYLVMELVEGEPITTYAEARDLGTDARVRLAVRVCEAVAYAHQHLVVHRDLKPSNVLVTGDGGVKLLDFGIAKLLEDTEPDLDLTAASIMTPAYAAPEQVRGEAITTATDVYGLGVLFYELLAGQRPYDLSTATASQAERIVCDLVPPPASTVAPHTRARRLTGDLDTILAKALAKDPTRRYTSAEGLGDDLRRHLDGLPIDARPASAGYRARLFVRRHRLGVAAAAAVVVALLAGLAGTAWQARVAAEERDRATAALARAEGTLDYLESSILMGDPQSSETDPPLSAVLDSAAARVDTEADPAVAVAVHNALANVYLGRGDPERALHHAQRAVAGLGGDRGLDYVAAQTAWAQALADGGDAEAALPHHDEALAALETLPDADAERGIALNTYAVSLFALGRNDEAEARYREAIESSRRAADRGAEATALQNVASLLIQEGRTEEAIQRYEELVTALRQSGTPQASYGLPFALVNWANALSTDRRDAEALRVYREAVGAFDDRLGAEHPESIASKVSLAFHLHRMGRFAEARAAAEEALTAAEAHLSADHPYVAYAQNVAGTTLCDGGAPERGAALHRASLAARRQMLPPDHWILANGENLLGACLARLGQTAEARRLLTESTAALDHALGTEHPRAAEARERLATFEREGR